MIDQNAINLLSTNGMKTSVKHDLIEIAKLNCTSKSSGRTTLATVNALNAKSLVIRCVCVSMCVAIFSASREHASKCNCDRPMPIV